MRGPLSIRLKGRHRRGSAPMFIMLLGTYIENRQLQLQSLFALRAGFRKKKLCTKTVWMSMSRRKFSHTWEILSRIPGDYTSYQLPAAAVARCCALLSSLVWPYGLGFSPGHLVLSSRECLMSDMTVEAWSWPPTQVWPIEKSGVIRGLGAYLIRNHISELHSDR